MPIVSIFGFYGLVIPLSWILTFFNVGGHADFPQPSWHRLPELDLVEGVGLFEGQDPPQGPLKQLQLIPDSAERRFGPPQLNCSPLF